MYLQTLSVSQQVTSDLNHVYVVVNDKRQPASVLIYPLLLSLGSIAGRLIMRRTVCKGNVALVLLAGLSGCFPYVWPRDPPELVLAQAEKSATIRPGETKRSEVHALLGAPWLSSRFWQVDVHRISQAQLTPGAYFVFFIPVPGVWKVNWDGYVLTTYDEVNRVTAFASGDDEESFTRHEPCLQAADMILSNNWNKYMHNTRGASEQELVLLAGGHRLASFLELQRQTDACTVIVACEKADCPDQIKIDNFVTIDPRFVRLGDCPDKTHVPVLHLLNLAPGKHGVAVSSSNGQDRSEATINCSAGDVRYVHVQSEVIGKSFWRVGEIQTTLQVIEDKPESWSEYSVLIWRSSGWWKQPLTVGEK